VNIGGYCAITPGVDRIITPLPVFHTNALVWSMMAMMQSGGCVIQLDRFHSSNWWETVQESKATILHYLGVMPAMLLNLPETESDMNPQINFGLGGGVEPELHARFEKRFGFPLIEGWAMTETGSGVCFMSAKEPRHIGKRCIGQVTSDMEIRIVGDNGEDVSMGTPGELLVRRKGNNIRYGFFTEYYKNAAATAEAWTDDWFHTGDIVRQDYEDAVFFVERKKNIIRRSGENIAAAEVENILIDHPDVANCAITALPDPIREEEVAAVVVLNKDSNPTEDRAIALVQHCLEKLSYYKVPGYIIFVDSLPVTSTQKIQRGELRKICLELGASTQSVDCRHLKKKKK
jgi:acyl-CoA synthetase (AMP-forming)/AMP-acid ligase II